MAFKLSISACAPYLAVLLVGYSIVHPSRDMRTVSALRDEFRTIAEDNARLRDQFAATLDFLRNLDFSQFRGGADLDVGGADAPPAVRVATGCGYLRAQGRDGVRHGSDWWLVGDVSPWGVLQSAYRGGFVADGDRYAFFDVSGSKGLDKNDK